MVFGTVELNWPKDGVWHGMTDDHYIFFKDHASGREGEVHGRAANMLFAYMGGCWEPLIGWRLAQMGSFLGGDCSHQILERFKEDEMDRIDMQMMYMEAWVKDEAAKIAKLEAEWAEYLFNEPKNVQRPEAKVQSLVWQKASGLRSTAPNFSAITSFTTQDSKPKLNGG